MLRYLILLFIIPLSLASCSRLLREAEIVRKQNVRKAAQRYARGDWIERREAVKEVVKYIGPKKNDLIIGTLIFATNDVHKAVQIEAVKQLSKIKSSITIQAVKNLASRNVNDNLRWYALKTLASYKDVSSADIFAQGISSEDWLIREASISGMLQIDDIAVKQKYLPYIIKAINDTNESVSSTAMRNVKMKDMQIYGTISKKLNSLPDEKYTMIEAALVALTGYKLDKKTKEKVINFLVHPNSKIRILALRVLKKEKTLLEINK